MRESSISYFAALAVLAATSIACGGESAQSSGNSGGAGGGATSTNGSTGVGGGSKGAGASGGAGSSTGAGAGSTSSSSSNSGGAQGMVSFHGNWDSDPAQGEWHSIQVVDPAKLAKDASSPTWHGLGAARVEVDPGDDPLNLGENTERAEVLLMQDDQSTPIAENEASGTQYFALSYQFPADWAGTELAGNSNSWSIVLQLHGPDDLGASPAFSLSAAKTTQGGTEKYSIGTNAGDLMGSGCCGPGYAFSDGGAIDLGHWTDLVVMITFASTPTGHITVWRRDQGAGFQKVVDQGSVATLQFDSTQGGAVGDHYWKQGLYRGGVNRTDVLWMGPTVRATSFVAAEQAAFGTSNGEP